MRSFREQAPTDTGQHPVLHIHTAEIPFVPQTAPPAHIF